MAGRFRNALLLAGATLTVGGCGIPIGVTVAGYYLDGISLAETGKTVTDHMVSMVFDQDCRMWRVVGGEPVCIPVDSPNPYIVAAVDSAPERTVAERQRHDALFGAPQPATWARGGLAAGSTVAAAPAGPGWTQSSGSDVAETHGDVAPAPTTAFADTQVAAATPAVTPMPPARPDRRVQPPGQAASTEAVGLDQLMADALGADWQQQPTAVPTVQMASYAAPPRLDTPPSLADLVAVAAFGATPAPGERPAGQPTVTLVAGTDTVVVLQDALYGAAGPSDRPAAIVPEALVNVPVPPRHPGRSGTQATLPLPEASTLADLITIAAYQQQAAAPPPPRPPGDRTRTAPTVATTTGTLWRVSSADSDTL